MCSLATRSPEWQSVLAYLDSSHASETLTQAMHAGMLQYRHDTSSLNDITTQGAFAQRLSSLFSVCHVTRPPPSRGATV